MYDIFRIAIKTELKGQSKNLNGRLLFDAEHLEGRIVNFHDDTEHFVMGNIYFLSNHGGIIIEMAEVHLEETSPNLPNKYYAVKKKDMTDTLGIYYGKCRNDLHTIINDSDTVKDINARILKSFNDQSSHPVDSIEKSQ